MPISRDDRVRSGFGCGLEHAVVGRVNLDL